MDEPPPDTTVMSDSADDSDWLASDDISVLRALLQTPEPRSEDRSEETQRPWRHTRQGDDNGEDDNSETKEEGDDPQVEADGVDHGLMVTALRRQVHLLQQEYDRHLEQSVARSVVKAGGKSAPRAATIKLYRNYERLARVAQELVAENQRLLALLHARQRDQEQWLQSAQSTELRRPFKAVSTEGGEETEEARAQAQWSPMTDRAEAKDPPPHQLHDNEEIA